jgi:hypothetical protein
MVRKKLNKDASENNFIVLAASQSGCCGETIEACKYYWTSPNEAATGLVVKIDGVNQSYSFPTAVDPNNIQLFKAAIRGAIKHFGYFMDDDEFMSVSVYDGQMCVIGEMEIVTAVYGETLITVDKSCELGSVCKFVYNVDFETDPGILSGSVDEVGTQISSTDGWALLADIQDIYDEVVTAFNDENISLAHVVVTANAGLGFHKIVFHVQNTRDIYISGVKLEPTSCKQGYIVESLTV